MQGFQLKLTTLLENLTKYTAIINESIEFFLRYEDLYKTISNSACVSCSTVFL